jgi:uncharacterized alkaline shock family protein YloU
VTTLGTPRPGDHLGDPLTVTEIRVAATAADAARSTRGVAHLQPGLWGLVHQFGSELWTRVTGQPRPDTAGVEVAMDRDTVTIDVAFVADGCRPAADVGADVQRRVHAAVLAAHDIAADRVAVHVVDILLPG